MFPDEAVIFVVPAVSGVASPLKPDALLIVAIPVSEDFQVTEVVIFCDVLSE